METINIKFLTPIIMGLLIVGGISLDSDNAYYCEDRSIVMQCEDLSGYYGLDSGKCINSVEGNKLCRSGWQKIEKDTIIEDVKKQSNSIKYNCNTQGCVEV